MTKCAHGNCPNRQNYYGTRDLCPKHLEAFYRQQEAKGLRVRGRTPTSELLPHLETLKAAGLGQRRIAQLAGVASSSVRELPSREWVTTALARKILAVRPDSKVALDKSLVDATGSRRRLQGLAVAGHSQASLARELNTTETRVQFVVNGKIDRLTAEMRRRIIELTDRLCHVPGTSVRARNKAKKMGWVPLLAWDDIDRDLQPAESGAADFWDTVNDAVELGYSNEQIADILGVKWDTVKTRIKRSVRV